MNTRARALAAVALGGVALVGALGCRSTAAPVAWRSLFDGATLGAFVPTDFGGQGDVAVDGGRIRFERGSPLTGITWTGPPPTGDYELELTAARLDGADFFLGLTFPVGDAHLTLILGGWGGTVCGLSCLDGLDAAHNGTRVLRSFATGREYAVRVVVTAATVAVWIDEAPLLSADLAGRTCSLRAEVVPSRPLGIASFLCTASVRDIRWRPLASPIPGP